MAEILRWVTGVVCNYNTSLFLVKRRVSQLMAGVDPWNTARPDVARRAAGRDNGRSSRKAALKEFQR
jgi:hypothetical protein